MQAVQLQGCDAVGPEPTHEVPDPHDEDAERVSPLRGRVRNGLLSLCVIEWDVLCVPVIAAVSSLGGFRGSRTERGTT